MNQKARQVLGAELFRASRTREVGAPFTERFPGITLEDAYYIQMSTIEQYIANGIKVTGKKIGLTSKAMQNLFGVYEPDFGSLLSHMAFNSGDEIPAALLIQPKVEAEIAFVLQNDLIGPKITARDVLDATAYVTAAIEVVDSRFRNWQIRLPDTIADNASFGAYVLANTTVSVKDIDLRLVGMVLERNGTVINTGAGAAAMGHPANCVAWLANKMNEFNTPLKKGDVILSGAVTAAAEAKPGDYFRVQFDRLGEVTISFSAQG
ncbi:MAG: 2-hydroxypenta-2,4-dienoate hydratase [Firmicutes bacterium]|nr:2-hydroxypenta-2,4-dienoate hydratase [Bacillota bacterium]